jgi:hypothetical protein
MTGPEDFPATDVLRWEQVTVDKAFAEMVMVDDNARNAADWEQRLADNEDVTDCDLGVMFVEEPRFQWELLLITATALAFWVGIGAAGVAAWNWLVPR